MLLVAVTPSGSLPMIVADVLARLVLRVHPAADKFEVGVFEHALDGGDADASRRPLHDPQAHSHLLQKLEHVLLRSTPQRGVGG